MPALSTTPVAIAAGSKITNTGSARIYFDRQATPTYQRHIGHIEAGGSSTFPDQVWIVALDADTTYTLSTVRQSSAWNPTGPWSTSTAYYKGDVVTWLNGSFVALADIAVGGSNPRTDTTNWLQIASGGGEISRSELQANWSQAPPVQSAFYDPPGMSIVVPANSGPHEVEVWIPAFQVSFGAGATTATVLNLRLNIEDEGNLIICQGIVQMRAPVASAAVINTMVARRVQPNNVSAKTYRARITSASVMTNIASFTIYSGTGNITEGGVNGSDAGPSFIRAKSV